VCTRVFSACKAPLAFGSAFARPYAPAVCFYEIFWLRRSQLAIANTELGV
jgi:hypothetical protein